MISKLLRRIPDKLMEDIRRMARDDERTANAEMLVLLREAVAARKKGTKS